ncbi:MAG: phosphoglycerate kinase, partial [Candidatus Hermodarchaeota archaeon]
LTGGLVSQLLLIASGKSLGKPTMEFIEKKNLLQFIKLAEKLLSNFKEQIKTQIDFAVNMEGRRIFSLNDLPLNTSILDIGDRTIEKYVQVIKNSSTIVYNGPMGKIEDKIFEKGTLEIFKAMGNSKGFSLAGGGHSISIIEKYDINLSYISTAGKAMIQFLMGKPLPAIKALESIEG